jgi:hypothetical protein
MCLHDWLCRTRAIGVMPARFFCAVMCTVLLSAVDSVLLFCIVIIYGVKYGILEVK